MSPAPLLTLLAVQVFGQERPYKPTQAEIAQVETALENIRKLNSAHSDRLSRKKTMEKALGLMDGKDNWLGIISSDEPEWRRALARSLGKVLDSDAAEKMAGMAPEKQEAYARDLRDHRRYQ